MPMKRAELRRSPRRRILGRLVRISTSVAFFTVAAVMLALSIVSIGAGDTQPTAVELESWRKTILKTPEPKTTGCFTATYPETAWREIPCKTPLQSNKLKLYLPIRPGGTRTERVGGTTTGPGVDFSPKVTGHISEAEGSFDSVIGVAGGSSADYSYTLQLNTEPFTTTTCSTSPNPASCQGWEQFVYSPSEGGTIQYWLLTYGPAGTACPTPRGASCFSGYSSKDGWCPFQFDPTGPVYCVINAVSFAPVTSEPITSLGQLKVTGTAAGGGATTDKITVWVGSKPIKALGNNYFPDLGSHWQIAEFNVFGDGGGSELNFNTGSTIVVRTSVDSGTTSAPGCYGISFTGESNNLTLVDLTPPVSGSHGELPSLVFKESNAPGSTRVSCAAEVNGTIEVKGAKTVGETGVAQCSDLEVFARSKDFSGIEPKWQRHATATGTWANGSCNYTVKVVANSEFNVNVYYSGPCGGFSSLEATPTVSGWFKLPNGDTKKQNFTVTSIDCAY